MKTDEHIIKGCRRLNRSDQKLLLERYAPVLMAIAMRYLNNKEEAKDVLQETWVSVFNNIDQYKDGTNLRGWMSRIIINKSLKMIQRRKSYLDITEDSAQCVASSLPTADDDLGYEDLLKVVSQLSSPSKEVFMMSVIDGMSHSEISAIMSIAKSTSRVHLSNARKALRMMLESTKINLI